jgi:hypothetical protein
MFKLLTIITLSSIISTKGMANEFKPLSYKNDEIDIIEINNESGSIEAETTKDLVSIKTDEKYDPNKCETTVKVKDKKLTISIESKEKDKLNKDSKCETGIKISSPSDKKLILTNGSGSIKVKDFISGGDFEEGAGTIEFENVSGEIKTKIGAGNIKGIISSDNVSIMSGSGKIDLKWNKILDKGMISIKIGSGNTLLSFPKETKMNISFISGIGRLHSEFVNDDSSDLKIYHISGSGNLKIKKLDKLN